MEEEEYQVLFYDIVVDKDTSTILEMEDGEYVKSEDYRFLKGRYEDSKNDIDRLTLENEQLRYKILTLQYARSQNINVVCPRCKQPLEDDRMKRKHCHVCDFEWSDPNCPY